MREHEFEYELTTDDGQFLGTGPRTGTKTAAAAAAATELSATTSYKRDSFANERPWSCS